MIRNHADRENRLAYEREVERTTQRLLELRGAALLDDFAVRFERSGDRNGLAMARAEAERRRKSPIVALEITRSERNGMPTAVVQAEAEMVDGGTIVVREELRADELLRAGEDPLIADLITRIVSSHLAGIFREHVTEAIALLVVKELTGDGE